MPDITKRLRYFNGQFLEEKDFSDEQEYHLDRLRRHNRLLHTYGIAEGLEVTGVVGGGEVTVGVGTALDNQGRMIVLSTGESLSLNAFANKTVLVVISYDQTGVDPATVGNQGQATRWEERPKVQLVDESAAPSEGTHIRLARVEVSGDRTISVFDDSVRQRAGVKVGGELAIPSLKISSDQRPDEDWPEITSDAERRVRLDDHLAVGGNLTAGSVATTGNLTAGTITTSGGVTAGSLSTTGNLTVAGITASGNVSGANLSTAGTLTAGSLSTTGNLTVAGITASGTITGASITTSGTVTAGGFTTTGALSAGSITTSSTVTARGIVVTDSLSFPSLDLSGSLTVGGTITGNLAPDTVQAVHIADAAITTDKLADYAVTTNEIDFHAVNNSKLAFGAVSMDRLDEQVRTLVEGALPERKYELRQRKLVIAQFYDDHANGAMQSIDLGFQPYIILTSGFVVANMNASTQGGITTGFVEAASRTQYSAGPNIHKTNGVPYVHHGAINSTTSCGRGVFLDSSTSPGRQMNIEVVVESITTTGLVLRLVRTTSGPNLTFPEWTIRLNLYCMGY